jgi:hypothetical protein
MSKVIIECGTQAYFEHDTAYKLCKKLASEYPKKVQISFKPSHEEDEDDEPCISGFTLVVEYETLEELLVFIAEIATSFESAQQEGHGNSEGFWIVSVKEAN